jgi:transcription elongation GreA/GreB family factor
MEDRLRKAEAAYDEVVSSNPEAAEAGDSSVWHDNFAYEENQRQMHQWSRRVRDLRELLAHLHVVHPGPEPRSVAVGCEVVVLDAATSSPARYVIAGYDDGDPARRRISYNSPLGKALLGASVGEVRTVQAAGGERELEVLSIAAAQEDRA